MFETDDKIYGLKHVSNWKFIFMLLVASLSKHYSLFIQRTSIPRT